MDTHAASHSFAVIAPATTAVGQEAQFPATAAGLSRAVAWAGRHAGSPDAVLVVVEGIGSYGAGVARAFAAAGYRVVEGGAQSVGDRRGKGKSDALDAVRIARSVIGTDTAQLREPRADGIRNALRILIISREMMTRERTATVNALNALVVVANFSAVYGTFATLPSHSWRLAHLTQLRSFVDSGEWQAAAAWLAEC